MPLDWGQYIDVVELEAIGHECDIILYCEELNMDLDVATKRFVRSVYGETAWGSVAIRRADGGHWQEFEDDGND